MLALTTLPILATVAYNLDLVVQVSFRHIQLVTNTSRAVGQRRGKQGIWFCAGEIGLGKQAG